MAWGRKERQNKTTPGVSHSWRLWRHCCCRYGWWPLVISPIITTAVGFSVYSAAGCDFVRVEVGFTPSNPAWNESKAELGIFLFQSDEEPRNRYEDVFLDGCRMYEQDFNKAFVDGDRTWKVARAMASIAAIAGCLAALTSWMFVISPISAFFWWPGVLLPSLMVSFLAEGSKFLFFDTSICRNLVWYPSGANSLPRVAETCELGVTGYYSIAAATVYFFSLILVCLKAPRKRELDPHYGMEYDTSNLEHEMESGAMGSHAEHEHDDDFIHSSNHSYCDGSGVYGHDLDDEPEFYEEEPYHPRSVNSSGQYSYPDEFPRTPNSKRPTKRLFSDDRLDSDEDCTLHDKSSRLPRPRDSIGLDLGGDCRDPSHHRRHTSHDYREGADGMAMMRTKASDLSENLPPSKSSKGSTNQPSDLYNPTKPDSNLPQHRISASRKSTIEKLQLNTAHESEFFIEQFVSDLNLSFQVDSTDRSVATTVTRDTSGTARTAATKDAQSRLEAAGCSNPFCVPQSASSF